MAMTSVQNNDMYRFFIVAFNAAPGAVYMNQLDQAFSSGMTTKEIVEVFTTKDEFLSLYPSFLSRDQFTIRLIENVVKQAASEAAKSEAIAQVAAALASGMSRGEVIFNIFNNIAAKPDTDKDWGRLVLQMNNQIAAAEFYTSVLKRETTDLTELRSVVAGITDTLVSSGSATISSSGTVLSESEANDGSISNSITFSVLGDTFVGAIGLPLGTVTNVPGGLTASLIKQSSTTAVLTLTGQATNSLASNSISNLTVKFTASDMALSLLPRSGAINTFSVSFFDLWPKVSATTLSISQPLTGNLVIDLIKDRVTHGGKELINVTGSLSDVASVNLSAIPPRGKDDDPLVVTFVGDSQNNTYVASPVGDRIHPGGGEDIIYLGAGADRIFFPRESVKSQVTLYDFVSGKSGDVLDFSAILTKVGTSNLVVTDTNVSGPAKSWSSGDVLLVQTASTLTATQIAALFGTQLASPSTAAKIVLLTADVRGDTSIWVITNQSGTGVTAIAPNEVELIGLLKDVNNLSLVGLVNSNFGGE